MAFYKFDEGSTKGLMLRQGLTALRDAKFKLGVVLGAMNQMSDAQIAAEYGFADTTAAGAAKAELAADVSRLTNNASQDNVGAALQQMLDQFA